MTRADLCEQEKSGGAAEDRANHVHAGGQSKYPGWHGTLPLIIRADLCEQKGTGGVAEDRANHVQEARVNTSLGMSFSL